MEELLEILRLCQAKTIDEFNTGDDLVGSIIRSYLSDPLIYAIELSDYVFLTIILRNLLGSSDPLSLELLYTILRRLDDLLNEDNESDDKELLSEAFFALYPKVMTSEDEVLNNYLEAVVYYFDTYDASLVFGTMMIHAFMTDNKSAANILDAYYQNIETRHKLVRILMIDEARVANFMAENSLENKEKVQNFFPETFRIVKKFLHKINGETTFCFGDGLYSYYKWLTY